MNTRAFTVSLILAIIGMYMVYAYIEGREVNFLEKYGTESPVVVAKTDIQELDLIDDRKVMVETVPKKFLQPGHFASVEEVYNTMATVPIAKGEQITKPRVTYPGARTGLSRQVSVGKRAVSLLVQEETSVGKLIKPGDRVDILALIDYGGGRKDLQKVTTILQDVLVLATGKSISNSIPLVGIKTDEEVAKMNLNTYTEFNVVTLEMGPIDAQKLIFIITAGGGRPYLSLRNNNDKNQMAIRPVDLFGVLDEEERATAKKYFQEKNK